MEVTEHLAGWNNRSYEDKTHGSSSFVSQHTVSEHIRLFKHQAVMDFLYKHIHLMYFYSHFSTCWMICIVFLTSIMIQTYCLLNSILENLGMWTISLKIMCNFCSEYILPSIMTGSYISNEGSTCVNSKTVQNLSFCISEFIPEALSVHVKTMHKWLIVLLLKNVTVCMY